MTFEELLDQVRELVRERRRVSYAALKRRFELSDEVLEDLKVELIEAEQVATDENGRILVWGGGAAAAVPPSLPPTSTEPAPIRTTSSLSRSAEPQQAAGERRQLTVEFIDLVGSTTLSQQLDPEDYHARVVAYQAACQQLIARYDGHIAQYLGDGVLAYFGYPAAHEDDAVRAVRSGLEIITAVRQLEYTPPLQVRIGIHTGPVVVGEIGAGERTERLALGETPNIAARVQGHAAPNEVLVSPTTFRLIHGLFETEERGPQELKGISTPLTLYRVVRESTVQSRFEAAVQTGLTPLVGRAEELALLQRRWDQAKAGDGHVVLLSGEPGIGKSRLVQELKEHVTTDGATRIEFRCSPYHQNSAFYPIIDHLQRLLQFTREDAPEAKLKKLEDARIGAYGHAPLQSDAVPLLAALLSLPHPNGYPPITVSPQKQKERTQAALVAWLVEEAAQAAVFCTWEDLHWVDPSTQERLTLFLGQVPTARVLTLLTFRPEFTPPWGNRSHLSPMTLSRLGRPHVETMVEQVTRGKALPSEVLQQIVSKTDGVPLFVEELTKTVVESGLLKAEGDRYVGAHGGVSIPPLAIPSTLQDSLMARLDRLASVKEIAQLGATIGREFSYELLHAVSPVEEGTLQQGLRQLVEVELLYQRGLLPHATYLFKHALIQDAAYQSLLKSTRQRLHQQIAQVLEERLPDTKETQLELLAHHYTEAGLSEQAIPYWQSAGQRAVGRSAHTEAIRHLSKGLDLLKTLPGTPERDQHELTLQLTLGTALQATKGMGAPETGATYARARELCRQIGETPRLFPVLFNLWFYSGARGEHRDAAALGRQLLNLAEQAQDAALFLEAHHATWTTAFQQGNFMLAREHLERGHAIYHPQTHHAHAFLYGGHDPGVCGRAQEAGVLWMLGYPDQALKRTQESLALARELAHPMSLAIALSFALNSHQFRREPQVVRDHAEAVIAVCSEQGFPFHLAWGTIMRGWALAVQGHQEEGVGQMRHGLAAQRATGADLTREYFLGLLAAVYWEIGQPAEGLLVLAEALAVLSENGQSMWEAELYRLKGELSLQSGARGLESQLTNPQSLAPRPHVETEAEACFLKALEVTRQQQAKSLELRATVSLARLWHHHGRNNEARQMLAEIYGWFTEGFDTKDLQEAKALLEELS